MFHTRCLSTVIDRLLAGRTPAVLGMGAMTAVIMSAFEFTGGSLRGPAKDKEADDFEKKEVLRKARRIPITETISQLGEGRGIITQVQDTLTSTNNAKGIYAPGYDERRQQRLKENYGIDVPAKSTHTAGS